MKFTKKSMLITNNEIQKIKKYFEENKIHYYILNMLKSKFSAKKKLQAESVYIKNNCKNQYVVKTIQYIPKKIHYIKKKVHYIQKTNTFKKIYCFVLFL